MARIQDGQYLAKLANRIGLRVGDPGGSGAGRLPVDIDEDHIVAVLDVKEFLTQQTGTGTNLTYFPGVPLIGTQTFTLLSPPTEFPIPAGEVWRPISVYVRLVASAVAGNRFIALFGRVFGSAAFTDQLWSAQSAVAIAANAVGVVSFARGLSPFEPAGIPGFEHPIPENLLNSGFSVGVSIQGAQAGDTITGRFMYERYLSPS